MTVAVCCLKKDGDIPDINQIGHCLRALYFGIEKQMNGRYKDFNIRCMGQLNRFNIKICITYENLVCHPEGRTQLEDVLQGVLFNAEPAHRICINSPCCITDRILEHLLEEMISLSCQIYLTLG